MFLWGNKKNINTFGLKKAPQLVLWPNMASDQIFHCFHDTDASDGWLHSVLNFRDQC